jgi:hypothetical protein
MEGTHAGLMSFVLHFFGGYTLRVIRLIGSLTGLKAVNGYDGTTIR